MPSWCLLPLPLAYPADVGNLGMLLLVSHMDLDLYGKQRVLPIQVGSMPTTLPGQLASGQRGEPARVAQR